TPPHAATPRPGTARDRRGSTRPGAAPWGTFARTPQRGPRGRTVPSTRARPADARNPHGPRAARRARQDRSPTPHELPRSPPCLGRALDGGALRGHGDPCLLVADRDRPARRALLHGRLQPDHLRIQPPAGPAAHPVRPGPVGVAAREPRAPVGLAGRRGGPAHPGALRAPAPVPGPLPIPVLRQDAGRPSRQPLPRPSERLLGRPLAGVGPVAEPA